MAKVIFELRATVCYYSLNGKPITMSAGYFHGISKTPGLEYHDSETFYTKRFEGKKVWDLIDEIENYRRTPEFIAEIDAAEKSRGIDRKNKDVYSVWIDTERIRI